MKEIIVNFVKHPNRIVMNTIEKRDFIHSHLHQVDESTVDEFFKKMLSLLNKPGVELTDELKGALDQAIKSLDEGKGIPQKKLCLK
jgi:ADP-heptose:LPS heptosyltransferase